MKNKSDKAHQLKALSKSYGNLCSLFVCKLLYMYQMTNQKRNEQITSKAKHKQSVKKAYTRMKTMQTTCQNSNNNNNKNLCNYGNWFNCLNVACCIYIHIQSVANEVANTKYVVYGVCKRREM